MLSTTSPFGPQPERATGRDPLRRGFRQLLAQAVNLCQAAREQDGIDSIVVESQTLCVLHVRHRLLPKWSLWHPRLLQRLLSQYKTPLAALKVFGRMSVAGIVCPHYEKHHPAALLA